MPGVASTASMNAADRAESIAMACCSVNMDIVDKRDFESEVCRAVLEDPESQMECFRAACDLLEELVRENDCHQVVLE
jgi:hypothetical protein